MQATRISPATWLLISGTAMPALPESVKHVSPVCLAQRPQSLDNPDLVALQDHVALVPDPSRQRRFWHPIPGFTFADCQPVKGNDLAQPVQWQRPLSDLHGAAFRLEFSLRNARLYGFAFSHEP